MQAKKKTRANGRSTGISHPGKSGSSTHRKAKPEAIGSPKRAGRPAKTTVAAAAPAPLPISRLTTPPTFSNDFENKDTQQGLTMKLWRGERMALIGFDVAAQPEPDFVGFAIECKGPGDADFTPLPNRIAFSYDQPIAKAVTGKRIYSSLESPFQKFRWLDFPFQPSAGTYEYRATQMHMPTDNAPLVKGTSITLDISLDPVTYHDFVDVGFTRNFASSQAFIDKFPPGTNLDQVGPTIIPTDPNKGLTFPLLTDPAGLYEWMGFEARELLLGLIDEAVNDPSLELNLFTYDFNEPNVFGRLMKLARENRLRVISDNSGTHAPATAAESQAARQLQAAGAGVVRLHFKRLQHNKVVILRKKNQGAATKVLCGSCNHSYRGIYIQANNVLVFDQPDVAALFASYFDTVFADPTFKSLKGNFANSPLAAQWHVIQTSGKPTISVCLSPHKSADLSLNPVRAAIDQAQDCVLYNIAFLNMATSDSPTRAALDRLMTRPLFSYGVSDKDGKMALDKPDGSRGLVDFAYLAKNAPEPFKSEWSGQKGINIHHKFVVTDFARPTAKVFTGSCNMAKGGEESNGDHLIEIDDCRIATSYAIEAVRVFDHLHFRDTMKKAKGKPAALTLKKPTAISGKPAWFESYYDPKQTQRVRDREIFST